MENNQNTASNTLEDEVTLKELILKLQEYYREIIKNWKLIILIPIPFVIIMFYMAYTTPKMFSANLTFMINEDEGGGMSGVGSILSQFGLGGGSSGQFNLDKMLDLSKSRKIVQKVLLKKILVKGKEDYLANHLIQLHNLHKEWEDDTTGMATFLFTRADVGNFSRLENKALKRIHKKIIGGQDEVGLLKSEYGMETGIITIGAKARSEELSILIVEILYEELKSFYVEKTIEKQKQTYDVVATKTDSIKTLLNNKEYALAHFKDSNRGLWTAKTQLKEMQLGRDVQILNILFGEAIKNQEIADFALKNKTPFVQIIDAPVAPLKVIKESKIKAIFLGGLLGVFFAITFILARKIFRDAMQE